MQARSELLIGESNTIAAHRKAVERVILEMRKQLDEPFSLDKMARIACLSPFHFDRVFHELTCRTSNLARFRSADSLSSLKRFL